jgi:GT2 family glycosyltransferase
MTSTVPARVELYGDSGNGFNMSERIDRVECPGVLGRDFFVRLPRPVRAVRFDPLDREGEFRLHHLRVEPVPRWCTLPHAFRAKLRQFHSLRNAARALWRGVRLLLQGDFGRFTYKLLQGLHGAAFADPGHYNRNANYEAWRRRRRPTVKVRDRWRAEAASLAAPPLLSLLLPLPGGTGSGLSRSIESVFRQVYEHWELCIAPQRSLDHPTAAMLADYARRDPRLKVLPPPGEDGTVAGCNSALRWAAGEYVAFLEPGDELAEHALLRVGQAIAADRELDLLYTDEDRVEEDGRHVEPFFKPAWSPESFLSLMYTGGLGVYRTAIVRELGGLRQEFDGAHEYDLALRVTARSARVGHVPEILYHRGKPRGAAAVVSSEDAARRALESHLAATGRPGRVEPGLSPGCHRVRFTITGRPRVSILIPSACRPVRVGGEETTWIARCVASIRRASTYADYGIFLVTNSALPPDLAEELDQARVTVISYTGRFNWSAAMNLGAAEVGGDHFLFLNDDVEIITADWIEAMLELSQQPDIGAVGAKLCFPDGRLQHVGVTLHPSHPRHSFYLSPGDHPGYFGSTMAVRNCSAVTGACLMTRADVFRSAGGFTTDLAVNYNDIDYCLKVRGGGRRVVFTPFAQLTHYESATRTPGATPAELKAFQRRWGELGTRDPYYNPNLSERYPDYRIELDA